MAAREIHEGDIGTIFEVTLQDGDAIVDISAASEMYILFEKADGTTLTKTAVHKTDGTDGILQYVTILDDLTPVGNWKVQAHVVLPTGSWKSDISKFKVYANLV
jgi:hypothetical protein